MYKLNDSTLNFMDLLTSKWDQLHDNTDIFRYKVNNLDERIVEEKYLLQLNPDRQVKRRAPEEMTSVRQPFDNNKFNFTKVSPKEILFSLEGKDSDVHTVLVNVSPISRYHSLVCPSVNKCLPQVVTVENLELAVEIMFQADRNLRIAFNSMCGYASVNHLHYHLLVEKRSLYVENVKWEPIKGCLYRLEKTYPMPAFCFKVEKYTVSESCKEIYKTLKYLLDNSIAHNIMFNKRDMDNKDAVNVIVWPRRNTTGAKQLAAFNVAVLELSGWFPIYDPNDHNKLRGEDLLRELLKWKVDNFEKLCEEIKCLY